MSVDNKFLVRDKITLKVTGLGSSGEGVGKTDGFTVFAHGALADETVEVELEQVKNCLLYTSLGVATFTKNAAGAQL